MSNTYDDPLDRAAPVGIAPAGVAPAATAAPKCAEPSSVEPGTMVGEHSTSRTPFFPMAPTAEGETNTLRLALVPIACWRLNDFMFHFGTSFVTPDLRAEMPRLARLRRQHVGCPAALFGHADPVGKDDSNKRLSGRRAAAIYGLLVRDVDLWERLYSEGIDGDRWGIASIQLVLSALQHEPEGGGTPDNPLGLPAPYYSGPIDGAQGSQTTSALKTFQAAHGLAADGIVGPSTRKALFATYMDWVCQDDRDCPFRMQKEDFILRGAYPDGKGDYQGCSEFNPVLRFSKAEEAIFARDGQQSRRNSENATNRRVVLFLFEKDSVIPAGSWPCPALGQGPAGCRAMFWPDGEARRAAGGQRRQYAVSGDTFACRFYDQFARLSPCEGGTGSDVLEIRLHDESPEPLYRAYYRLTLPGRIHTGRTADAWVRTPLMGSPDRCLVEWNPIELGPLTAKAGLARYQMLVYLDVDSGSKDEQARRRLHNIGYHETHVYADNLTRFQSDYGLIVTGTLTPETETELWRIHDSTELEPGSHSLGPKQPGSPEAQAEENSP